MQGSCHRIIAGLVLLLLAGGCDQRSPTAPSAATKKPVILSTTYPMAELARRVAGKAYDVQWLCDAGQHPADLPDTPDLRGRAAGTTCVLTSGPGDVWATANVSGDLRVRRIIEPERMPSHLAPSGGSTSASTTAYEWLDPLLAIDMTAALAERLAVVDPGQARTYQEAADAIRANLMKLDGELRDRLARRAEKNVLVVRPIWGAFCRRYGLEQVAPVTNVESKLTTEDYKAITSTAKQFGLTTLYVDASTPLPVRQEIGARTKLKVRVLDATGTSAPDGNSTYEKLMRYNLRELVEERGAARNE